MHSQLHSSKVRLKSAVFTNHVPRLRLPLSEFNNVNGIPSLKVGALVYKDSRLSKCQRYLLIGSSLYGLFIGHFVIAKQTAQFSVLRDAIHRERTTLTAPETSCIFYLSFYLLVWDVLFASDRNHVNTSIVITYKVYSDWMLGLVGTCDTGFSLVISG